MTPGTYLTAALGGVVVALSAGLYFTGQAYLKQRDETVELRHTADISRLTQAYKEQKEIALTALKESYDGKIRGSATQHKEAINDLTLQLMSARNDALQKPLAFGDDLLRDFIFVDCLWSLGENGNSIQGRKTCRDEATNADPSSAGVAFTVLTPTFLQRWGEACEDWFRTRPAVAEEDDLTYTEEAWREEYGSFDKELCFDSLVGMTPEAAIFFKKFIENGRNYTAQLIDYAVEQNQIIDILVKKETPPPNP